MKRPAAIRQIHGRVAPDLKKAIKMFCVREGATEQSWVHDLVEGELKRRAPDLWVGKGKTEASAQKVKGP
jgi:hypothetical protein